MVTVEQTDQAEVVARIRQGVEDLHDSVNDAAFVNVANVAARTALDQVIAIIDREQRNVHVVVGRPAPETEVES